MTQRVVTKPESHTNSPPCQLGTIELRWDTHIHTLARIHARTHAPTHAHALSSIDVLLSLLNIINRTLRILSVGECVCWLQYMNSVCDLSRITGNYHELPAPPPPLELPPPYEDDPPDPLLLLLLLLDNLGIDL
jgi:hypothetical protein